MKKYYVYKILKNTKVVYVGHTANLEQRHNQHKNKFGMNCLIEVVCITEDKKVALEVEKDKIFECFGNNDPVSNVFAEKDYNEIPISFTLERYLIKKLGGNKVVVNISLNAVLQALTEAEEKQNKYIL